MEQAASSQGRSFRRTLAAGAVTVICAVNLAVVPIAAAPSAALAADPPAPAMTPIDAQNWQDQKDMTWADYHSIPGVNWADPTLVPTVRSLKIALVAVDMPDQPFVITMPKGSDPYGNPQIDPIARSDVPAFYRNFLLTPSALNHYQTINGYWMEQSRGQLGVTQIDAYGPYQLPKNLYQYGLNEYSQNSFSNGTNACPAQTTVTGSQTGVNTVTVGSSAFFYAGDIATFSSITPSGSKVIAAIPDATHLTIATTTLGASAVAGSSAIRVGSLTGLAAGHAITVDPGVNAEMATIAGLGSGTASTTIVTPNAVGDTVLKVASISGLAAGNTVFVDTLGSIEPVTVASVGTAAGSSTTTVGPTAAGATTLYVASVSGFTAGNQLVVDSGANLELATIAAVGTAAGSSTTLAAAAAAGATNVKVTNISSFVVGHQMTIDSGANIEVATIAAVGTAGAAGTGIDLVAPLVLAHNSGVNTRDRGTGITVAAPLAVAHNSGVSTRDTGTGVTVLPLTIAHASGVAVSSNGITLTAPLAKAHLSGYGILDPSTTAGSVTVNDAVTIHDCTFNMDNDVDAVWRLDKGSTISSGYDVILRIYAGYDETSVWQEFGEMMFQTKEDIPRVPWGNPNPALPNYAITRYVPWTSWKAAQEQWGLSSVRQGESSGTITHELAHFFFSIGDNNNNPFQTPYHRVGSAPWDIMDRGSFNGPGGVHFRWLVPVIAGGSMPAGFMLRNKIRMNFLPASNVLNVNRNGLAASGLVVDTVTARGADPGPTGTAGIKVVLDGPSPVDKTPACSTSTDPFCRGNTGWDQYNVEVVQRIGYDSFTPDNGVLLSIDKTSESSTCGYNCFNWVIDAHPEDINLVDYYKPDGTPIMRTVGDLAQLNDAAFHAGTNSGSQYEWEDPYNHLHFYVLDKQVDANGIISYIIGVQNPTGTGPQTRGVAVEDTPRQAVGPENYAWCSFNVNNTGTGVATDPALHPEDLTAYLNNDIYRLSASASGTGWHAELPNALASAAFGAAANAKVYVTRDVAGADPGTIVSLTATSVSDGSKSDVGTCAVADAPTTTTLTADFNPTQYGHPVTFSATVAADPAAGIPTGAVQFSADGAPLGAPVALDAAGVASLTTSGLGIGTHSITADYAGAGPAGAGFQPSSASLNHEVKKRLATTTAVTSNLAPSTFGALVTFSATVSPENASSGIVPTGFVQFKVDGVAVGGPQALTAGVATVATDMLAAGNRNVRAQYLADPNYTGSTSPVYTQQVKKATPTGSVVSDLPSPILQSDRPTFTATFVNPVAPLGSLAPANVQFLIDGTPMGAPVALTATPAGGTAAFHVTWSLPTGNHTIKARYLGNASFLAAYSAGLSLRVNP